MERLLQDLRYGARHLRRSPAFSIVAILTLAIGIGASTAIFTHVNAVFWKELPVDRPDQLRSLAWTSPKPGFVLGPNVLPGPRLPVGETYGSFSYIAYLSMRDGATSFSDLACWLDIGEQRPIVMGEFGFGAVQFVSGNYFRTLGVPAALGRTIAPDDDRRGAAAAVAVVSHRFWQRVFGGDGRVLNRTITLNGRRFAIVGVTPQGFFGFDPAITPDVMVPMGMVQIAAATSNPLENPGIWIPCRVVGRLRPGVADEQARAEAETWLREAIRANPPAREYDMPRMWITGAAHGLGTLRTTTSMPLLILMSVVVGLVVIACANIAGLLIARGTARQKEIATRLALGAARSRLVRQLVTESVLLALAGGAAGVALAYALGRTTATLLTQFMPTFYGANRHLGVEVAPDVRVLLFSSALALLTGLAFGLAPAFRATRLDLVSIIKQTAATSMGRGVRFTGAKAMVAMQAALAMLLLVGAGLFIRTVTNLRSSSLGYEPRGLLYVKVEPRTGGIPADRRAEFFENAVKHLERVPGVVAATAAVRPPMGPQAGVGIAGDRLPVCTPGFVPRDAGDQTVAFNAVAPRFFETMRLPLVAGRDLEWRDRRAPDRPQTEPVALVNEAFAKKFYPGTDAIGQKFGLSCPSRPDQFRVVGLVGDSRVLPRREAGPTIYLPLTDAGDAVTLIVRTGNLPAPMIQTIRRAMSEFNPSVPVFGEVTPLELREQQIRQERLLTTLLVFFGVVALLLACLGIYGMLAYSVNRRTREIGLRMALGAQRIDVIGLIVRESIAPVAVGILIGLAGASAAARWIESLLFGVSKYDPWTIAAAATVFMAIGALAAFIPARRASRIDPLVALRSE